MNDDGIRGMCDVLCESGGEEMICRSSPGCRDGVVPQRVVWTMPRCMPVCEGCGAKEATFGTPLERKRRWCRGCGKAPGAINLLNVKMCEGCGAKAASFGTPLERKRRWCKNDVTYEDVCQN